MVDNSKQETPATITETSQASSEDEFEEGISVPVTHPMYLAPTDTSGISLIYFQLIGTDNFSLWYRYMKIALLGRNKLRMFDGRWKKEKFREKYWYQWERSNAIVLSWLINVVALTLISGIAYVTNAHTVWMELQERFDKANDTRCYSLHKEITTLTQGILGSSPNSTGGHYESTTLYSTKPSNRPKYKKNFNLQCEFYKLKGHIKENCYKIVGYPADCKFKKKGGVGSYNAVAEYGSTTGSYNSLPELSSYIQPRGQPNSGSQITTMQPRSIQPLQNNNHYASMEQQPQRGGDSAFPFTKEQYDQIMQILNSNTVSSSSASNNYPSSTSQANAAGTNIALLASTSPQEWIIDTRATNHIVFNVNLLNKVSIVEPSISRKVLLPNGDVTQVTHVGDSQISNNNTLKEDLFNGMVKEIVRERDGLYFLQQHGNKRLAVVSLAATRTPFPNCSIKSTNAFDLIYVDVWGPYKTVTFDGYKYFLLVVYDFTRMTWVFVLKLKSDVSVVLPQFIAFLHTQFNKIVKMIRSDNGTEFLNSVCRTVFNNLGILHQTTCAYTLQQNGVVERKHMHPLEITRALRFQAHILIMSCGHCVITTAYLINRLPSSVLKGCSPYEVLYNMKPHLGHLRTLGCLCFVKQVHETDKLMPRAKAAVLMGFSDTQKGYILLDISIQHFFVNRDVILREDVFPFKDFLSVSPPIFKPPHSPPRCEEVFSDGCSSPHINLPIPSSGDHLYPTLSKGRHSSLSTTSEPCPTLRISLRTKYPPLWLKDFVTQPSNTTTPYSMANYVSYNSLSPSYQSYIAAFSTIVEPSSYEEAIKDPRWVEAMKSEIAALEANHTWEFVSLPPGKMPICCKWIFKVKYKST
ncbi:uncharacterized protein [Nicotiana sylvestris]|uniref:uncharacterized protein n=1 Tax=Nicotiana sylvestris TaxID=4096 RepID=UPI00388C838B